MPNIPLVLVHVMPWFNTNQYSHWSAGLYTHDGLSVAERYAQTGRVASHFSPLIGPYESKDPDTIALQLDLLKQAGVDGIIVDWYGASGRNDYTALLEASDVIIPAAAAAGLLWCICYEDRTVDGLDSSLWQGHLNTDLKYIADTYPMDSMLRDSADGRSGNLVLLNFGPINIKDTSVWTSALAHAFPGETVRVLGVEGPNSGVLSDGNFGWPAGSLFASPTTAATVTAYLSAFYNGASAFTPKMGAAFPMFKDYYREGLAVGGTEESWWGVNLLDLDGQTLQLGLDMAKTRGAHSVQIATLNDWQEGTIIEPSYQKGFKYLLQIQQHLTGTTNQAAMEASVRAYYAKKDFGSECAAFRDCDAQPLDRLCACKHTLLPSPPAPPAYERPAWALIVAPLTGLAVALLLILILFVVGYFVFPSAMDEKSPLVKPVRVEPS